MGEYLTTAEVAVMVGRSEATICQWRATHRKALPFLEQRTANGQRRILYHREDVERFIVLGCPITGECFLGPRSDDWARIRAPRREPSEAEMLAWIEVASYRDLLWRWRHSPEGSRWFLGLVGETLSRMMQRRRGELDEASAQLVEREVGWRGD